jgi:hypothetical protein
MLAANLGYRSPTFFILQDRHRLRLAKSLSVHRFPDRPMM